MKIIISFLIVIVFVILGCSSTSPNWPTEGVFQGYYTKGFEVSSFTPDGIEEEWWLDGSIGKIVNQMIAPKNETSKIKSPAYIVVRGKLSPPGNYGHLGHYNRELVVEEVIEVKQNK